MLLSTEYWATLPTPGHLQLMVKTYPPHCNACSCSWHEPGLGSQPRWWTWYYLVSYGIWSIRERHGFPRNSWIRCNFLKAASLHPLGTGCAYDTTEKQVSLLGGHLTGSLSCLCDKEHFTSIHAPEQFQSIPQEGDSVEGRTQHHWRPRPSKFGY